MANEVREYRINLDPRILELLGPSLYTNIYFVLAELIANSYDADAGNVYIIQRDDAIVVEDDGSGMSYQSGDIEKYLDVAVETRSTEADSYTSKSRRRMGRKGIGKLAALSVSENVYVMTSKDEDRSGFILSRKVGRDHQLKPLTDSQIKFERVTGNGTSIVLTNPEYGLHKTGKAIKDNLLKIFPLVSEKFRVHVITNAEEMVIDSFDKEMISHLGALLTLGNEFSYLTENFDSQLPEKDPLVESTILQKLDSIKLPVELKNKSGENVSEQIEIKGWIGAYRTTKDRKRDHADFPDNFISLLSNGKLGEYNILPAVGKNRLPEVYIVGQLHVDLFEKTELPDMALSNRQGYRTEDPRYVGVINYVRDTLLPKIIDMREQYADHKNKIRDREKLERQRKAEEELRIKVEAYKDAASRSAASRISKVPTEDSGQVQQIIADEMNASLPLVGIKQKVDSQKRRILICHTRKDKCLADIVYKLLIFNDISEDDIIYTSSDNEASRIPEGHGVFDYLRDFFVNSYSDEKIQVLYVTSKDMAISWGAVTEVGAGWITKKDHKIFNISGYKPELPLNIAAEWQTSSRVEDNISMTQVESDKFVVKIVDTCTKLGYSPKAKEANLEELGRYITIG